MARYTVDRISAVVFSERSIWLLFALPFIYLASHVLYIWSLPQEDRVAAGAPADATAAALRAVLTSNWMSWLGWLLFAAAVFIFVPVTGILWNRIQRQGVELQRWRDDAADDRVSSRNSASIHEYDERAKRKFGARDEPADD